MAMTAREQLDAFLQHCTTLRHGYLFKFNRRTSSLRYFVQALEDAIANNRIRGRQKENEDAILALLKESSPKDHVKYVPAVKSLIAVWGTTKDYVRLREGDQSANIVRFWRPGDDDLQDVACGIAVCSRYPGFHVHVRTHLNALYQTAAGKEVLDFLVGAAAEKRTSIVDHVLTNQCAAMGFAYVNAVARELYKDATKFGDATRAALARVNPGLLTRNAWLAREINQMPRFQLKGFPPMAPANLGVTEGQVAGWVGGRSIWDDYGNDAACNQIKNAVIVALYPHAAAGVGTGSMVNYCLGTANPMNAERPPGVGLAHELIHAYYNLRGEQPGAEVEDPTTVLFEYRCVGLGPWANEAISENKVREQWNAALLAFDPSDDRNRKMPAQRAFYSPP
jgi:hypothetical protein